MNTIKAWLARLWDLIVRLRTWIFNTVGAGIVLIAPILGAPEIQAAVPRHWLPYIIAAVFLINIWLRPRPAATSRDKK